MEEAKGLFEEILVAEDSKHLVAEGSKQKIRFSKVGLPFAPSDAHFVSCRT